MGLLQQLLQMFVQIILIYRFFRVNLMTLNLMIFKRMPNMYYKYSFFTRFENHFKYQLNFLLIWLNFIRRELV